ncbi:MAG: DUF1257 domain-containing protein [Planctomycetota bacterium]|nr:DUF1257 domain-containing protein [Planctomycetota bacterium]
MSHIVEIKTEVRDVAAARAACQRLKLEPPVEGKTRLFSGEVEGLAVHLPDWRYPVVFETGTGQAHFDNFNERWGKRVELDRFLQSYGVEKAKLEARKAGHSVYEQPQEDGSIKLTVQVGGAA